MGGDARNLSETIHSLLGLKAQLTSAWIESVCGILNGAGQGQSEILQNSAEQTEPASEDGVEEADLGGVVSKLKEEINELQNQLNQLNCRRRHVLNDYLDLKGNIRVFCRVRPLSNTEVLGRDMPILGSDSSNVFLEVPGRSSKTYTFDKVFEPSSSQAEVFREVEPVIKSALDGFNATIFAYGQTGTGKTFTMEGTADNPGVVPRAIEALFEHTLQSNDEYSFSFSMLEIYMGNLRDLLVAQRKRLADPMPPSLVIQRDPSGGIEIENLSKIRVGNCSQALALYELGSSFRSTATTNSNATSSRSHCMTRISITCSNVRERRRETSKVWLIDLGGSERVLKTKAHGRRLEEGKAINLSLSALGDVINALHWKKSHIPFRNSKLTQVLKDSLGEDSKMLMLVHVSPREEDICETICTLSFAARAKSIRLGTEGDAEGKACKEAAMQNLQETMDDIEGQSRNLKVEMEKLNRRLVSLTRTSSSSYGDDSLTAEASEFEIGYWKNKSNCGGQDQSKVPQFMMPTICSRKKGGIGHRAGPVIFPIKKRSEYRSEFGDSRSCLVGTKSTFSTRSRTECSHDTSIGKWEAKMAGSSKKGSSYSPNDRKERTIKDLKDRPRKQIPGIRIPFQPKNDRNLQNTEEEVLPGKPSFMDFQMEDHEGLVQQGSDCGGSTSETDMQSADSSTDSSSAYNTSETATEAGESVKCAKTSSIAKATHGYDNPAQENRHECWLPESNAESEDTGPSSTGGLLRFKAGRALFRGDINRDGAGIETGKRKTGLTDSLRLKILQIMVVVLIGVGLRGLGFEHDFFPGLAF